MFERSTCEKHNTGPALLTSGRLPTLIRAVLPREQSEIQLQRALHNARCSERQDLPEGSAGNAGGWTAPVGMVQDVKHVGAEIQQHSLR